MNLKYFKNIDKDTYEILIHGEIGAEVNGADIAAEILMLNNLGAKVIRERINTVGGTVKDAYSIVSANLASDAEIHTINEGIADSSGSWILASGNNGKRFGYGFSTVFLHNPTYKGKTIEEIEDENIKKNLTLMRDSIIDILSANTGKSIDEVKTAMDANTRLSAKQSMEFGFIDEILPSKKTPELVENMSLIEMMNACHDLNKKDKTDNNNLKSDTKMKDVLNFLNLSEDAQESSALKAIQNIEKRAEKAEKKLETVTSELEDVKNQVTEKDTAITDLEAKIKDFEAKEIKNAVDSAISSGKFAEEKREDLVQKCETLGVEDFKDMVEMINVPKADALAQIDNKSDKDNKEKKSKDEKLVEKYQNLAENDPMELARLKNESPKEFEEMLTAWNQA